MFGSFASQRDKVLPRMNHVNSTESSPLFTVGHSNHPLQEFLQLLSKHGIQVLVDTRSHPYSKYVTHFNREELGVALKEAGVKYLYLGRQLGGRPDEEEYFDEEGHVLYYRLAQSPVFLEGIQRVEAGSRQYRVALLCSEEDPAVCHRHLLVARVLAERGAVVAHIRGDGTLQDYEDIKAPEEEQPLLFDIPGLNPWKSLRSVSRKRAPRSSSDSSETTASGA
jgi:Protein of unknown function, DUF488